MRRMVLNRLNAAKWYKKDDWKTRFSNRFSIVGNIDERKLMKVEAKPFNFRITINGCSLCFLIQIPKREKLIDISHQIMS